MVCGCIKIIYIRYIPQLSFIQSCLTACTMDNKKNYTVLDKNCCIQQLTVICNITYLYRELSHKINHAHDFEFPCVMQDGKRDRYH